MRAREFIFEYKRAITARNYSSKLIDRLSQDTGLQASFAGRSKEEVADLKAQLNDNPEIQEYILSKFEAADPTKNKQYTQWIISRYIRGDFLYADLSQVKSNLEKFIESAKLIQNKDLNQYDYDSLKTLINDIYKKTSSDAESLYPVIPNTKVLYNGPLGQLVIPETFKSSMALQRIGRKTVWCTADSRAPTHFEEYNNEGPLYVWIDKSGEKYQFHFEESEFKDHNNDDLSPDDLTYLFTKNPVLSKLAKEKIKNDDFLYLHHYIDKEWIKSQPELVKKISIYDDWRTDPLDARGLTYYCDNCEWEGNYDELDPLDTDTCPECHDEMGDGNYYNRHEIVEKYVSKFFQEGYHASYGGIFAHEEFYKEALNVLDSYSFGEDSDHFIEDFEIMTEFINGYVQNYNYWFPEPEKFFETILNNRTTDEYEISISSWILNQSIKNARLREVVGDYLEKLQAHCFEIIFEKTASNIENFGDASDAAIENAEDNDTLDQGLISGAAAALKYMNNAEDKIYNFYKDNSRHSISSGGMHDYLFTVCNRTILPLAKNIIQGREVNKSQVKVFRIIINGISNLPISTVFNERRVAQEIIKKDNLEDGIFFYNDDFPDQIKEIVLNNS